LLPVLIFQVAPEMAQNAEYNRAAIDGGQAWRLLTCHLTHCNWEHLFWDAAMFALLGTLCERRDRTGWGVCCLVSALAISCLVWVVQPEILAYRGLSGVDTALFVLLAIDVSARRWAARDWMSLVIIAALLIGLIAKTAYEAVTGGTLFVDHAQAGFVAVPLAHLAGAATGLVVGLARRLTAQKETGRDLSRPAIFCFTLPLGGSIRRIGEGTAH
jgi:rhomboid family GlyGly-CTERM serine protease